MAPPSIERRVVLGSTLAVALTVAASGVAVLKAYRAQDRRSGEQTLRSVLEVGADRIVGESLFAQRRGEATFDPERSNLPAEFAWAAGRAGEAEWIATSEGFPDVELERGEDPAPGTAGTLGSLQFTELVDERGVRHRAAVASFEPRRRAAPTPRPGDGPSGLRDRRRRRPGDPPPREAGPFTVLAITPIQGELDRADELSLILWLAGASSILAAALLIRTSVRRGLGPLAQLSARIEGLDEGGLEEPVVLADAPGELTPIVAALEGSRVRLARSFAREQRFTDDVAHELRTPLAGLRANLEVALRRERSAEELRELATQDLASTLDLQQIVDSLLLLRRSRALQVEAVAVDLQGAIEEAFDERTDELAERELEVQIRGGELGGTAISGDAALVRRLASNLASNAAAHSTRGSTIHAVLTSSDDSVRLRVENQAEGLTAETAVHAFEAFWRAEAARSVGGVHHGLGLAIVRTCAEAMGGQVEATSDDGWFRVDVELPRSSDAPS